MVANTLPVPATIRAQDLSLVLCSIKLRAYSKGRTARLCALSETLTVQVHCRDQLRYGADFAARAKRVGQSPMRVSPLQRGDIGNLYERVKCEHGRREVMKTWGVGIRALLAEPLYVLDGGSDL